MYMCSCVFAQINLMLRIYLKALKHSLFLYCWNEYFPQVAELSKYPLQERLFYYYCYYYWKFNHSLIIS